MKPPQTVSFELWIVESLGLPTLDLFAINLVLMSEKAPAKTLSGALDLDFQPREEPQEPTLTPPSKQITYAKNSGGIIFGAIAPILRNQLRKRILREIFSKELRKFRVTQHGRVCCLSSHQLHKIILGELIS